MSEYGVFLRNPNKQFQIKENWEERIDYLKNIQTVRKFFLDNYVVTPPIINSDHTPLNRNESLSQELTYFYRHEGKLQPLSWTCYGLLTIM